MYTFAIPDTGSADVLLCFPVHGEIDVFSRPGFSVSTFSISRGLLESFLERNHAHELIESLGITDTIFFAPPEQIDVLRYLLKEAPAIAQLGNKNHAMTDDFQEGLLSTLLQVLYKEKPGQWKDSASAQHALDHVIEYV
ncbi:MAG: hypothetical protein IZT60_00270 [Gammaproteobacteria bacterium]|nr:hypothetical protein [Gammaproteobacteria bacterium]